MQMKKLRLRGEGTPLPCTQSPPSFMPLQAPERPPLSLPWGSPSLEVLDPVQSSLGPGGRGHVWEQEGPQGTAGVKEEKKHRGGKRDQICCVLEQQALI